MPTHDRVGLLGRALASAFGQTYTSFEVLVVDDGSQDGTPGFLAGLSDPRLRTLRNPRPRGAAAARNRALRLARGEFIAFLDDDDEWLPRKLERQLERFAQLPADVAVVYTLSLVDRPAGPVVEPATPAAARTGDVLAAMLDRGSFVLMPAVMARRSALLAMGGFDEALPKLEDWDLWIRMSARFRFAAVEEPLARVHPLATGMSRRRGPEHTQAMAMLAGKHADLLARHPRIWGRWQRTLGFRLVQEGQRRQGRAWLRGSLKAWPWSWQAWACGVLGLRVPALRRRD